MKKIEGFTGKAQKANGEGEIEYCLWADTDGALFVQMVDNLIETRSPGSHSTVLFGVAEHLDIRFATKIIDKMNCRESVPPFNKTTVTGTNNFRFLREILKQLVPVPA